MSELKVCFGQFFLKLSSRRAEKNAVKREVQFFQENGQKCKIVIKIEFTPLSDCNILPFFKSF